MDYLVLKCYFFTSDNISLSEVIIAYSGEPVYTVYNFICVITHTLQLIAVIYTAILAATNSMLIHNQGRCLYWPRPV